MANEAVIIELFDGGMPVRYTVANATAISKGTLMRHSGDNTIAASAGIGVPFAGIAAADKVASDGATTLAVYTHGFFDLKTSELAGIRRGDMVSLSGANQIRRAISTDFISGAIVGKATEDGDDAEVIKVFVRV